MPDTAWKPLGHDLGGGRDEESGAAVSVVERADRVPDGGDAGERTGTVVWTSLIDAPLDIAHHEALVTADTAGAVVSFVGVVRNHDRGRGVARLEYSAHPSAAQILAEIAQDVASSAQIGCRLAVSHRVGRLEIGDLALACAVSAGHRRAAFDVCSALVEVVKQRLPVWKFQVFDDGTDEWVGSA
jgi:molybdopterin synthase catalytic subunit